MNAQSMQLVHKVRSTALLLDEFYHFIIVTNEIHSQESDMRIYSGSKTSD